MALRHIDLVVGAKQVGTAIVFGYPAYRDKYYVVPTYHLHVTGRYDDGLPCSQHFEVIRFGVHYEPNAQPYVVGLKDEQSYIIKAWMDYKLHSTDAAENGAWIVKGSFLIHDGPDDPMTQLFGSKGCIEICGWQGFSRFNDLLIRLSGATAQERDKKLAQIGSGRRLKITYKSTARPPLVPYQP